MNFTFILPRNIIFGCNSLEQLHKESEGLGGERALVVTSNGMIKRDGFIRLTNILKDAGLSPAIFNKVKPEPSMDEAEECLEFARKNMCDLVIGIGGGSVLDVAKKVGMDLGKLKLMLPTTAGTGSEVTHESVLKVDGKKKAFVDKRLTPDIAVVDPNLTMTMTPRLTASSGIDALAHAIECYNSKTSNPLVKTLAFEAYTIIKNNLRKAVANDREARINMALGSLMAGMAFGNSGTALCHALSYPLSGEGVPHGEAVAMMLPYALEFNNFDKDVITEIRRVISDVGLTSGFRFKGDIHSMAEIVIKDTRHLSNNPRKVTLEDIITIYEKWNK